jgi:hypothetical protein
MYSYPPALPTPPHRTECHIDQLWVRDDWDETAIEGVNDVLAVEMFVPGMVHTVSKEQ